MVHPVLSGGYVLDGGALCMELMTPQVIITLTLCPGLGAFGMELMTPVVILYDYDPITLWHHDIC